MTGSALRGFRAGPQLATTKHIRFILCTSWCAYWGWFYVRYPFFSERTQSN